MTRSRRPASSPNSLSYLAAYCPLLQTYMKNILLFSGSQRRDSLNTRLLNYVSSSLRTTFSIEFLGPDQVNLPLFNQDLEGNPSVISSVFEVHEKFNASDGIIVASPEYNGQVTPFLKNTVDWVSRLAYIDHALDNPFLDRPVLLCSASTGAGGGALGQNSARALFAYVGGLVLGDSICLPYADQLITGKTLSCPPYFEQQVAYSISRFAQLVNKLDNAKAERKIQVG